VESVVGADAIPTRASNLLFQMSQKWLYLPEKRGKYSHSPWACRGPESATTPHTGACSLAGCCRYDPFRFVDGLAWGGRISEIRTEEWPKMDASVGNGIPSCAARVAKV